MTFADASHGWAVGANGTIIATNDGGEHWTAQRSGKPGEQLSAVTFVDRLRGWIVGWDGTILATTDGGLVWRAENSSTGSNLLDVDFTDALHGWIASADGTLLTTSDGGQHWRLRALRQASGDTLHVVFAGSHCGWVRATAVGLDSGSDVLSTTLLNSVDGGARWTVKRTGLPMGSGEMSFVNVRHGWVSTNAGVYSTSDGGSHWTLQKLPPGPGAIRFHLPVTKRLGSRV